MGVHRGLEEQTVTIRPRPAAGSPRGSRGRALLPRLVPSAPEGARLSMPPTLAISAARSLGPPRGGAVVAQAAETHSSAFVRARRVTAGGEMTSCSSDRRRRGTLAAAESRRAKRRSLKRSGRAKTDARFWDGVVEARRPPRRGAWRRASRGGVVAHLDRGGRFVRTAQRQGQGMVSFATSSEERSRWSGRVGRGSCRRIGSGHCEGDIAAATCRCGSSRRVLARQRSSRWLLRRVDWGGARRPPAGARRRAQFQV